MVYIWLNHIRRQIFPTHCRLCRAPGLPDLELCADCRDELPWLVRGCLTCARPLPDGSNTTLCSDCQNSKSELDSCIALFAYQAPVDQWIQGLKFNNDLATARMLGELMAAKMPICPTPEPISLVPVPLHRKRLVQRGFNQSVEIARPLRRLGYKLDLTSCIRRTHTIPQSELPARRRRSNLRGVFEARKQVKCRTVIIIDDVLTTGATLNELARTLRGAGAEKIHAWVISRTISH